MGVLAVEDTSVFPGASTVVTSGLVLSAGYVLLTSRASLWLVSALTGQPLLWRRFDPVEVLFAWEKEKKRYQNRKREPEEEESLQSIVR